MSVTINYKGGFGNHLFQYIAARLFAVKHGLRLQTEFDDQGIVKMDPHEDGLDVHGEERLISDFDDIFGKEWPHAPYRFDGFFQKADWFYSRRADIMKFAHPAPVPYVNTEDIVMHVRLGDYKAMDWVIHPSWYLEVLKNERFHRLHIVTDELDGDYLSHFRRYDPVIVSSGKNSDWTYLRSFDRVVCSNSTFCWWALFFGSASRIIVFKRWIGLPFNNLCIPGSIEVDGKFVREMRSLNTSISDNGRYPDVCIRASQDNDIFDKFKRLPDHMSTLEHVYPILGDCYYSAVNKTRTKAELEPYLRKASVNDNYGGPRTHDYPYGSFSPTTLRYFKISFDLHDLFGDLNDKTVCEIGGGYGGQYVVHQAMFGCKQWDIVDLPEANALQQKYIDKIGYTNFRLHSIMNLSTVLASYDLVVSNYAFSECRREWQNIYVNKILLPSKCGYMIMNYLFDKAANVMTARDLQQVKPSIKVMEEDPKTYPNNELLVWV